MKTLAFAFFSIAVAFAGTANAQQSLSQRLSKESPEALAIAAREQGSAVRGAILFTSPKLACTTCHVAGRTDLLGPDLTRLGEDVTDVHLVESLLNPSKAIRKGYEASSVLTTAGKQLTGRVLERTDTKVVLRESGKKRRIVTIPADEVETVVASTTSTMPNNLVDQLANRGQFLDLVRYTMELTTTKVAGGGFVHPPGGETIPDDLRGLVLLKEYACTACHRDDLATNAIARKPAPDLTWSSGRIDPRHVERFLSNPHATKPGTTMPDVLAALADGERREVAADLAHFVASLSERTFERQAVDPSAAERGRDVFQTVGCVACHSPRDAEGRDAFPDDSVPLGPVEEKYNVSSLTEFLENPHAVRPGGRMPNLQLTHWEAIDVASYLLSRERGAVEQAKPFELDATRAERGKGAFTKFGCIQCHERGETRPVPRSTPLSKLRPDHGCLADAAPTPRFDLNDDDRAALRAALSPERTQVTDEENVDLTLTAFRCVNCHQRGTLGGVSEDRNPHFRTTNPNLGPQGRLPPTLTGVGAKLNPKWMRQVLVEGRSIRSYVLTRMPRFGTKNVEHLVELLGRVDELSPIESPEVEDEKELAKVGAEMVGTGGLNCIACHTFQLKQAANMSAVDLTEMAERLRKPWFHHYMRDPQRFSQSTIMPSYWPGGRAMRKDILAGHADEQIEALWLYLLDGRQARTPRGLIVEPIELVAGDEAVMLRRKWPGIGKRGIGVGYPRQVNLAFDAEQMRLALVWQGRFADPGGVWRSQGHGTVRPLGTGLITFAKGPDLDDPENPWIVDDGRPPNHRFRGYTLDEKRRPRFRYEFGEIAVEDYAVDEVDPSTKQPFLRRTLTLRADDGTHRAVFRAADGKRIVSDGEGVFVVDGKLRVRLDPRHTGEVVDHGGGQQLRVPLTATNEPTTLVVEYIW